MERISEEIKSLLKDFYELMGMKISVFDLEGNELAYYPDKYNPFCERVRSNSELDKECMLCDKKAMEKCLKTGEPCIYSCHAGLYECWIPLNSIDGISGFMTLGQIKRQDISVDEIINYLKPFGVGDSEDIKKDLSHLITVGEEKIKASAHILSACVSYSSLKEFVGGGNKTLKHSIERYIKENLNGDLSVDNLERVFRISRVSLYGLFNEYFSTTPAEFVKSKRLYHAKKLILTTDMPISKVAEECGIGDYNYFSKLFKKEFNVSPRQLKKDKLLKNDK
ncbi:MAG: PocR ligand-binding domain-containing protein [Clostridia bacterium]|nr:PocR ligand-binding domain-containing protein [Clostridia bacterium]